MSPCSTVGYLKDIRFLHSREYFWLRFEERYASCVCLNVACETWHNLINIVTIWRLIFQLVYSKSKRSFFTAGITWKTRMIVNISVFEVMMQEFSQNFRFQKQNNFSSGAKLKEDAYVIQEIIIVSKLESHSFSIRGKISWRASSFIA